MKNYHFDYDNKTMQLSGSRHSYSLGDKVEVMVVASNTRTRRIEFELADRVKPSSLEEIERQKNKATKESVRKTKKKFPINNSNICHWQMTPPSLCLTNPHTDFPGGLVAKNPHS